MSRLKIKVFDNQTDAQLEAARLSTPVPPATAPLYHDVSVKKYDQALFELVGTKPTILNRNGKWIVIAQND